MKTQEIRNKFTDYFKQHAHQIIPSSGLIPEHDPTLLFVNAGMVPFKDVFLGLDQRNYSRATSVQKCVRAGGKHNDLDNVGYTARHHTFFEMLGNFSFGDYFKREAIHFAWNFLTQELKIPAEKLWVTVFTEDQEAEDIWLNEIGISPKTFSKIGEKDNFWSMGDTGPCGPCTEIFYDHGESIPGGPPGSPDEEGDRFVEIWNLVFMQYNRDAEGNLNPLPKPSVDTGMGIERIAAVMQGTHDNFEIDLFQYLIQSMAKIAKTNDLKARPLRVIADHIRSVSFLIADGVKPSNEGRGYVLRRIMRRAIRYGHKLGVKKAFFYQLVQPLSEIMGEAYPQLIQKKSDIESIIRKEEQQFAKTLDQGLKILEADIAELKNLNKKILSGQTAFKLYDTYGFPLDLTQDIARERDLSVDLDGFEAEMTAQRNRARAASEFKLDYNSLPRVSGVSKFLGYTQYSENNLTILDIVFNLKSVSTLSQNQEGVIVLNKTPFYPESGGQVGDKGFLIDLKSGAKFEVLDTQKQGDAILHMGRMISGVFSKESKILAEINSDLRLKTAANHSATHLLHAALREILGDHIEQKGSMVGPDRLRFDFSHDAPLSRKSWREIEYLVNQKIIENLNVITEEMSIDAAKEKGAMALFGEKYDQTVRVLSMGDFSLELCGGTHVKFTSEIGLFKLISEGSVASGVRRLEAVTGLKAINWVQTSEQILFGVSETLNAKRELISERLNQTFNKIKDLEKNVNNLQDKLATSQIGDLIQNIKKINNINLLTEKLPEGTPVKSLRGILDQLKQKISNGVIALACIDLESNKINLIIGVTQDLIQQDKNLYHAGNLIKHLAPLIGGKGGGRPDMAQAGGSKPEGLNDLFEGLRGLLEK